MAGRQNVFDRNMSLHVIKDKIQLRYAERQAEFVTDNLKTLIENTFHAAPVRKAGHPYPLVRKNRLALTPAVPPLEKHWEEAIFRKLKKGGVGLDPRVPFERVVSYQVMLRETNDDANWGELDLIGATAKKIPVVMELKIKPKEYLLRAIVEVLAYGVAVRKAFSGFDGCPLPEQWGKAVGEIGGLVDLPLAVLAPTSYWEVVLGDSRKRTRFQTPPPVRHSIRRLLAAMRRANYPLTFVEVTKKPQLAKNGLPDVTGAVVRALTIPTGT